MTFRRLLICIGLALGLAGAGASASVCATVRIEIDQQLTFERQAFEASMTINNGLPSAAISNLNVSVNFHDANGNEVRGTSDPNDTTALFFITLESGNSIPPTVAAQASATIKWLIIPAFGAGGTNPSGTLYNVGAHVTFTNAGNQEKIDVTPAPIFVKPMPQLTLDYFLPNIVNGDDPFTPQIEPAEPFSLGVRVKNTGYGPANKLKIESSQPKIIDNRQGLLVAFEIDGASVQDQPVAPTLLADFGNLAGGTTEVARWEMTCSLYGRFVSFSATFSHADALGGRLTSLIQTVNAHLMLHDILVDLPGRDAIRDFLAYRFSGSSDLLAYESDGVDTPVNDVSSSAQVSGGPDAYQVANPGALGALYIHLPDPAGGARVIDSAVRSDGKVLPATNAWLSKVYDPNQERYSYYVSLFDTGNTSGLAYTVKYSAPARLERAPKLMNPGDRIFQTNVYHSFLVLATDPDADLLTMTSSSLPAGATYVTVNNGVGQLTWRPGPDQVGNYPITFVASDGSLQDQATIVISVTSQAIWNGWLTRYFGNNNDPSVVGSNANPSGDGASNIVKYALNLDPTKSEDSGVQVSVEPDGHGNFVTSLTYVRRTDDPTLQVSVVGSNSGRLTNNQWDVQQQSVATDQSNVPDGMQRWKAVDSVPLSAGVPRRFLRLEAAFSN